MTSIKFTIYYVEEALEDVGNTSSL